MSSRASRWANQDRVISNPRRIRNAQRASDAPRSSGSFDDAADQTAHYPPSSFATSASSVQMDRATPLRSLNPRELDMELLADDFSEADEDLMDVDNQSEYTDTGSQALSRSLSFARPDRPESPDAIELALETLRAQEEQERFDEDGRSANGREDGGVGGGDADEKDDLIELYKSHSRQTVDPAELKAAILKKLKKKVNNSLNDDRWMYEPDLEADSPT